MELKQAVSAAAAVFTAAALSLCCAAEDSGFYTEKELALAVKAPYDTKYVNISWNTDETEEVGVPLSWNSTVLLPVGAKVNQLSAKDGSLTASVELSEKVSENCRGAVLGNTLFQPTRTGAALINAQTMTVVSQRSFGAPITSDAAIIDNLAYFSLGTEGDYTFRCVDLSNDLSTVWEYNSAYPISAPTLYEEYVVFTTGTKLVCCAAADGTAVENDLGISMTGTPFAGQYALFTSAEDGCVYKLRLNADGTVEEGTLTPCNLGGELSSPVQFDGKLYVSSTEGFFILDSLNMEVLNSYPEIAGGTAPLICYGNGTRIYTVAPLEDYWCLYSICDMEALEEPQVSKLAKLVNFEGGRIAVSQSGKMFFRDGVGRVYALEVVEYSVLMIVLKLVLLLALFVIFIFWLKTWAKKRNQNKPPQY